MNKEGLHSFWLDGFGVCESVVSVWGEVRSDSVN